MASEVFFDFDNHTSFRELDIDIDGSMSTGSSTATWIYGNETARIKADNFASFEYDPKMHIFSDKNKHIHQEGEMVLVQNQSGDVYLVDWVDSLRNFEDGVDGVRLQYRQVSDGAPSVSQEQPLLPNANAGDVISFDFDYFTSFNDMNIDIDASMSTGGTNDTYIYGGETARVRDADFEGFEYTEDAFEFSPKAKLIPQEDDMALVRNSNGEVYLIDWVDSLRNFEDGIDGVKLRYRNVYNQDKQVTQPETEKEIEAETSPEPAPIPESVPSHKPAPAPEIASGNAPNLLKATLRGDQVILQFDDAISDNLPRVGNFTLNNGNREFGFKNAEVIASAGQVILTANEAMDSTITATLDYFDLVSDQINGVVQSKSGVDLKSFTGFELNNQTVQENTLAIDDGDFEGNTITLNLNTPISSSTPSANRFKIKTGRKNQKIIDVDTDQSEGLITLTTKKYIGNYESIKVSYRDLQGDQVTGVIEDRAGNDMATVQNFEILNGGYEEIKPELISAALDNQVLTLEFDSIINNTKLSKNRFKVNANGKRIRVQSASVEDDDESFVNLVIQPQRNKPIDLQSEVTLSYSDPKGDQNKNVVEDLFGNDLLPINNFFVDIV